MKVATKKERPSNITVVMITCSSLPEGNVSVIISNNVMYIRKLGKSDIKKKQAAKEKVSSESRVLQKWSGVAARGVLWGGRVWRIVCW